MLPQIINVNQPHPAGWWIAVTGIGIVSLYVLIKVEHLIVRLVAGFITLLLVAGGVWWLFFRH